MYDLFAVSEHSGEPRRRRRRLCEREWWQAGKMGGTIPPSRATASTAPGAPMRPHVRDAHDVRAGGGGAGRYDFNDSRVKLVGEGRRLCTRESYVMFYRSERDGVRVRGRHGWCGAQAAACSGRRSPSAAAANVRDRV